MTNHQRFVVIRHGESQTNSTNTFQAGNQCLGDPLTPSGEEHARRLAERLADLPVDIVLSSGYLRARTTAARIAEAAGSPHAIPVTRKSSWLDLPADDTDVLTCDSLLREIDVPSELEGLRFDNPRARAIQHAAMAVAGQPDGHFSDEENLYNLWRRAEHMPTTSRRAPRTWSWSSRTAGSSRSGSRTSCSRRSLLWTRRPN